MKINYMQQNDFAFSLVSGLEQLIKDKIDKIEIENIPSSDFCKIVDCKIDETNGWQCDWNGNFKYRNRVFNVSGSAWHGTINIILK